MQSIIRRIAVLLLLFCLTYNALAQNKFSLRPVPIADGIQYRNLHLSKDARHIWICGAMGKVIRSDDGGRHWKNISPYQSSREVRGFMKIRFAPDNLNGWLIGLAGRLYKTSNGGDSWDRILIQSQSDLNDITYSDDYKTIYVLDQGNVVHESNDQGKSWKTHEINYAVKGIQSAGNSFLTYTSTSGIYMYNKINETDIDLSKNFQGDFLNESINDISYNKRNHKYIGLLYNNLIEGTSSRQWVKKTALKGVKSAYRLVQDETGEIIYVLADYSKILKSIDGGKSFKVISDNYGNGFDYWSIGCSNDGQQIWVCGENRTIAFSVNGGRTFHYIRGIVDSYHYQPLSNGVIPFNNTVRASFYDRKTNSVYAAGWAGAISSLNLTTLKGNRINPLSDIVDFNHIVFDREKRNLFAVGDNRSFLHFDLENKKVINLGIIPKVATDFLLKWSLHFTPKCALITP